MVKLFLKGIMLAGTAIGFMFMTSCAFVTPTAPALFGNGCNGPDCGSGYPTPTPEAGISYGGISGTISGANATDTVIITATNVQDPNVYSMHVITGNGDYALSNIIPGIYSVQASIGLTTTTSVQVTVASGQNVPDIDFAF